ncbi:cobaltochelatase subunit CobN [Chelatococcus asaccharovorans]|uniref:cobaltochelatase subunit CobN n=1 Tax=Chelatococcus asaccharovorans TaxID=28210 RepID=UPI00224C795C|nr:cobaltochelatase subunit CobN [Chelatococcus asaccharovorans]CAH1663460.1 Cobaltochelatase CobN subunit [Chelatococcus asaccharovorans]CAH1682819.1 Cobaltochelatase CobN subunit [Chelatococcus asaccharovorans]
MHLLPVTAVGLDQAETPIDLGQTPAEMVILSFTDTDLAALATAHERAGKSLPTLRLANLQRLRHPLSVDLYVEEVVDKARIVVMRCLGGLDYLDYGLNEIAASCIRRGAILVALAGDDRPDERLAALSRADGDLYAALDGYFRAGGVDNCGAALALMANALGASLPVPPPQPVPAAGVFALEAPVSPLPGGEGRDGPCVIPGVAERREGDPTPGFPGLVAAGQAVAWIPFPRADALAGDDTGASVVSPLPGGERSDAQRPGEGGGSTAADPSPPGEGGAAGAGWGPGLRSRQDNRTLAPPDLAGGKATLPWRGGITEPLSEDGAQASPTALIIVYRSVYLAGDTAPITALAAALAQRGLTPVALFVSSLKDPEAIAVVEAAIDRERPAVILNTTAFSAQRNEGGSVLDRADCPVLQVILAGAPRAAWDESPRGLGAADFAMNVALPEIDGRLTTTAISFKAEAPANPALEFAVVRHAPDPAQIALVADRAAGWARLARTPPADRRIAVIVADYPSRGGRTGYAVGLDTGRSAANVLTWLAAAGYAADDTIPAEAILPRLEAGTERATLSLSAYRDWLAATPPAFRDQVMAAWGEPGDDPAVADGHFAFPVIRAGHVVLALQPERGRDADRRASYHDPALPPRHAYCAFYAWLALGRPGGGEEVDAIVHLGTHGTLEWLPGKTAALSPACAPQVLTGALPVIYPFIVNNPGEAAVARRRIGAVTIGHLTPPISEAGLHGASAELEALVDEYAAADGLDVKRQRLLKSAIVDKARETGLAAECGAEGSDDDTLITALDAWLCDLKEFAIRDGLHVLGEAPPPASSAAMAALMGEAEAEARLRIAASPQAEKAALLAALDGRFVPPGPAGAPTRGRLDVLPTGRNLTGLDPRAIPTRTALAIGERAAAEVLRRYLQDHGDWPRALVMDLWASMTLRTGGDDLAEALTLMGARPRWDHASNRVTGVEIVPGPRLDRPRIDVTLRISGLFRDAFALQITLFDQAVRAIAALDEEDDFNPLAAARRRGEPLDRIFSGAPGTYGAGVSARVLDGDWSSREALGEGYLAAGGYAIGADGVARAAPDAFRERVRTADALVHARDDGERDALDTDDVADFVGGFAAAAAALGASPALIHLDTSRPDAPRARLMAEEIARIARSRLANPRWIAGQLRHGYRGVAELAQGVDALYAFAATSNAVGHRPFELVFDAYVADAAVWSAISAANPSAARAIAARFADALQRGLWQPRRNSIYARLAAALGNRPEAAE